jgi:hypothetical protein
MQALAQRQHVFAKPFVKSGALVVLEAYSIAPFTTGLGNEHPLENGFAFLSPYGLPYLPGSGVKGVVRQAARELASGDWGDTNGWDLDESYLFRIGKEEIRLSLLDILFGRETPSGESGHVRGALSFWDVIPQIEGERLAVEVMTPHQGLGFGAKTSVGYGAFMPAAQSAGIGGQPTEPAPPPTPRAPEPEARNETVWRQARLQYNRQNRTLTAIASNNARASAFDEQAQELISRLPEDVQRRVRTNQFVRVDARVRGSELVDVETKS